MQEWSQHGLHCILQRIWGCWRAPQVKPQKWQLMNLDPYQQYHWNRSALICTDWPNPGTGFGLVVGRRCQSHHFPGPICPSALPILSSCPFNPSLPSPALILHLLRAYLLPWASIAPRASRQSFPLDLPLAHWLPALPLNSLQCFYCHKAVSTGRIHDPLALPFNQIGICAFLDT